MTKLPSASVLFDAILVNEAVELWLLEDDAFVSSALKILVDQEIEAEIKFSFVWLLRQGYSKHYVLVKMADYWGNVFRPKKLPGIRRRIGRYRLTRLPIIGSLLRLIFNLPSESRDDRRLRVIENQIYLLAKSSNYLCFENGFAMVPWGGVHRIPLLQSIIDAETNMTPAVKLTYYALINAASENVINKPEP